MPPKKLVRRARKSLRERRMTECQRELQTNFDKVEMKKYRHDKAKRQTLRKRAGKDHLVPKMTREVAAGLMTEELFNVEQILHARAGLPPPVPLETQLAQSDDIIIKIEEKRQERVALRGQKEQGSGNAGGSMQIGLVDFSRFASMV